MPSASRPPTISIVNENNRYIVPMSLWLVANTQRRQPCGAPCARRGRGRGRAAWPPGGRGLRSWADSSAGYRRSLARGGDFGRLHDLAGLVRPVVLGVGDDGGDLGVARAASRPASRRCAAPFSTMWICLVLSASSTTGEPSSGLIGPRALAVGLVADRAVGGVDLLAARHQVGQRPRPCSDRRPWPPSSFLLAVDPGGVVGLRDAP